LLRLPLPDDQRIHLPPGRYLFPWYYQPEETSRFAELLAGLLAGVDHHLILPWPAAQTLASKQEPSPTAKALLVVTVDDASIDDATIDEALARLACPHAMLRLPHPRDRGYAWQERHLKPALVALLQEHIGDEKHPLAALNIAALPVRSAASLTTDALGLIDLLEAAVEHRLARAAEGTSEADYEASLYAEAGRRFAERLLRLLPYQVEAALDVLKTEGAGVWNDERFRVGAKALEEVGLAQVAGGSVSLGPMARQVNDGRVLAALRERLSRRLPISPARRWVVETAPILDGLRAGYATNNLMEFASASVSAATGLLRVLRGPSPDLAIPLENTDRVRTWIRNGSDFEDCCGRARDFLSDPDRAEVVRVDPSSEYDVWIEPIKYEFSAEEWERINSINIDDLQHDETVTSAQKSTASRRGSRSVFEGFLVLDRKRFSSQQSLSRQIDALLDRRVDLKIDLARWMTFAIIENITDDKPLFLDLLSWVWRSIIENPVDGHDARNEAHDVIRRCLALTLKNGYQRQREHIEEDARAIGLDVSGVLPAWERPSEFLQKMKEGFEKMLDGAFADARRAYAEAGAIAKARGDAFDEWVAFHGEEDAGLASIPLVDRVKEESQSLVDDYRRRRVAMDHAPKVKEWMDLARQRRERVIKQLLEAFIEQNHRRRISGRSRSFSNVPHDYWTMFRELETIHAPPNLQRTYVQPLIDLGGFGPEEELRYRLQLGVDETEKTDRWVSRTIDDRRASLEEQRKRDDALLSEFTRSNTFKRERLRRLKVFPDIANIFRLDELDWAPSFFLRCQEDMKSDNTDDYARALCSYADLETRSVAIDRLVEYVSDATSWFERHDIAKALRGQLPLEQWVGLHADVAERLARLVLDLDLTSDEPTIPDSDEDLAWALFCVVRGVKRFGRALSDATKERARAWARRLLPKLPRERFYTQGVFSAAAHLTYMLAPNDCAREEAVKEALARAQEGAVGIWISLIEAGVSPTSAAMAEAADRLWANLDGSWDETLRSAKSNPRQAWPQVAFLAQWISAEMAKPLSVAQERLLQLVQAAPEQLLLCAEVLEPKFWGDRWQPFIDQVWRSWRGGDGPDPVAVRLGAVDLLRRWVAPSPVRLRELPSELRFIVDLTLLAVIDESPVVANHAAYVIVGYATHARSPAEVLQIAGALRRMATDPRLGVRGAAAYAGTKLPTMDVAAEIRAAAQEIDQALSKEAYAVIQRQRAFGTLDAKYPQGGS
jgi:hypothetical protein